MKLINAILINIIYMKFERLMFNSMDCWTVTQWGQTFIKSHLIFLATIIKNLLKIKASPCIYQRTKKLINLIVKYLNHKW